MKRIIALLLCLLLIVPFAALAEESAEETFEEETTVEEVEEVEETDGTDYAAIIAAKDEEIAELKSQLAELQATYETLLAKTTYTTLSKGSKGEDVSRLQEKLISLGYLDGDADGNYGNMTAEAVTSFQRMVGLSADGVANADTQYQLFSGDAPKATAQTSAQSFSADNYETYVYETALGEPDAYNGRKVTFNGVILQALENNGTIIFRIATSGEKDNAVYATYHYADNEAMLYKGDNIVAYGVTKGTKTYSTVTGNTVTIPAVELDKIETRG